MGCKESTICRTKQHQIMASSCSLATACAFAGFVGGGGEGRAIMGFGVGVPATPKTA